MMTKVDPNTIVINLTIWLYNKNDQGRPNIMTPETGVVVLGRGPNKPCSENASFLKKNSFSLALGIGQTIVIHSDDDQG